MPASPTVVADENIPHVRRLFDALGHVRVQPGRQITARDLKDVDVLLVRSVTPVDEGLLAGSPVRFVGSATIGTDHVDTAYLTRAGVAFAHAPGSNAGSVVEYVLAALLTLANRKGEALERKTLGVIGCGHVGGALAQRAEALGLRVLCCDPPKAEAAQAQGQAHAFVALDTVLAESDIVSMHTPLVVNGPHPTFHLMNTRTLPRMKKGAWLLNTSRGATVDNQALLSHVNRLGALVLDVWENEPTPDPALIESADLATPHIAGYSYDGKVRGTLMLYAAVCAHLGLPPASPIDLFAPLSQAASVLTPSAAPTCTAYLHGLARQAYAIEDDDARFRRLLTLPANEHAAYFTHLRKTYPRRRAWELFTLTQAIPGRWRNAVEEGLGMASHR